MRSISVDERRARLAHRHRLAPSARVDDDPVAIARSVVALHATDPATVVLSTIQRMRTPDPAVVARALFEHRTLVRMLAMRRTLWTVPVVDLAIVQRSSGDAVAAAERKRFVKILEDAGVAKDGARFLRRAEEKALAALEDAGELAAGDLAKCSKELAIQIPMNEGKAYAATIGVGPRVLLLLAADGRVVRGRTTGGWASSRHLWAPLDRWLGGPIPELPAEDARVALARAWLERFGPATVEDLKWWTGWTMGHTRAALAALVVEPVDLDGSDGLVLPGDTESPELEPFVTLLPGLDPSTMGWKHRDWYLGEHRSRVFDANGNGGPTVWVDGRIVGGWAQRKTGEVVFRLLQDVGAERVDEVAARAAALEAVLGEARVVVRFPGPLDKELSR
ncbi:MAG: winged helix DNA-binding domain-containing protein [Acidimicrobiales bacterium]